MTKPTGLNPAQLDDEQLASLTSGASMWRTKGIDEDLPQLVMSDGPHGLRRQPEGGDSLGIGGSVPATCFPPAAGLASSWNRTLIRDVGAALGSQARELGVSVLLGPGINIRRSPLGGRNFEYASEDPYLSGEYGVAFVDGVQSQGVAATPKHFAVNNQETDRFRIDARVDERTLREIYLAAFETVVRRAQPWALMCSYNKINGVYASENHWLLTEVLREEWGFDGLVISDWGAVVDRVASVAAGLDVEMPPSNTDALIVAALADGALKRVEVERAAQALSSVDRRTRSARIPEPPMRVDAESGAQVALRAARASLVLLDNDGILPLTPSTTRSVAVIGPFAQTPRIQGGGSSRVEPTRITDLLSAFEATDFDVTYAKGFEFDSHAPDDELDRLRSQAVEAARESDVAVVMVGLPDGAESEGSDRTSIELPKAQIDVLNALTATSTPVVVVVSSGSVVRLGAWRTGASAVVQGWLLGQEGGRATVDVLTGEVEPSGHLTETIPLDYSDTPSARFFPGRSQQVVYGEGLFVGYRHYDSAGIDVAYPFGHGLTYTTFEYSDLNVDLRDDGTAGVTVVVRNTGSRPGTALAQVYVRQEHDPQSPVHALRGFERADLAPGEHALVRIELDERAFAIWDTHEHRWRSRAGQFVIEVGESSRDIRVAAPVRHPGDGLSAPLEPMSTIAEWLSDDRGREVLMPLIERVTAGAGAAAAAPELREMFLQMPLIKLTSWGIGITEDNVHAMVEAAHG